VISLKKTVLSVLFVILAVLMCSCSAKGKADDTTAGADGTIAAPDTGFAVSDEDMFSDRDLNSSPDTSDAVMITLSGSSAKADSKAVSIGDGSVTVTGEGTYVLSGSFFGTVAVDAPEGAKVTLVLNGASVISDSFAALYVLEADKVFLNLAKGSENSLSSTGAFSDSDDGVDGAVFSRADLTVNGEGALTISSAEGHGIVAKDDFVVTGGCITVNALSHAIDANDSIRVSDGTVNATAGKDGLHAENTEDTEKGFVYISDGSFNITSGGDCLSASSTLQIGGGSFILTAGGGSVNGEDKTDDMGGMGGPGGHGGPGGRPYSYTAVATDTVADDSVSTKGVKAGTAMLLSGGVFTIDSADDSIHSNTDITISGGSFSIKSGDDAVHADGTLAVTGGNITVTESYEGLEGLHIGISGGTVDLCADDDGLNAAGGNDDSGFGGPMGGDRFMGGKGQQTAGGGSITICAGSICINASGDGIDANGTFAMSGGSVTVCGPTVGDTATLDYDVSATITGGTFIGTGASGMAQTFSDSSQGVIGLNVGLQSEGTEITVKNGDKVLISHSPELSYSVVILSCPEMKKGESYTVTVGDITESFTAS